MNDMLTRPTNAAGAPRVARRSIARLLAPLDPPADRSDRSENFLVEFRYLMVIAQNI